MHGRIDQPALSIEDLRVRFGHVVALDGIWLTIQPGELVALVGPNGAGKSTLFRSALGLVPAEGRVVVHEGRRHSVAYVAQRLEAELDVPMTVRQLVETGRRALRRGPWRAPGDAPAVARCLSRVGLDGLEARALGTLSGGQLQRALIARALAQEPSVMLLDETLVGIDLSTSHAIVDLLEVLAADGAAILLATHDLGLVRERFQRCVALNRAVVGDGHPSAVLTPEGLERFFGLGSQPSLRAAAVVG